jgi:PD-(D/E)XK endonuclease
LIGEISEAIVRAEFLKAVFPVALPFGDNQRYDMVVEVGGSFLRVQCKTARVIKGGAVVCFNARSMNPPERSRLSSYRSQADLFAAYSPHTKQVSSWNAIASPAARDPGPLVTLVRCLTVAKVRCSSR